MTNFINRFVKEQPWMKFNKIFARLNIYSKHLRFLKHRKTDELSISEKSTLVEQAEPSVIPASFSASQFSTYSPPIKSRSCRNYQPRSVTK